MFTRPRKPICPFVYHHLMTFLKQRTLEAENNKHVCDADRHVRAAIIDEIQHRACSIRLQGHSQALCLLCTQRLCCITMKRRAGFEAVQFL